EPVIVPDMDICLEAGFYPPVGVFAAASFFSPLYPPVSSGWHVTEIGRDGTTIFIESTTSKDLMLVTRDHVGQNDTAVKSHPLRFTFVCCQRITANSKRASHVSSH